MSNFYKWYADYSKHWGQSVKDDVSQDIDVIKAAWKARQPEIDKLKSEKDILFNTLKMILSENSTMRWQRAAINALKEVQGE